MSHYRKHLVVQIANNPWETAESGTVITGNIKYKTTRKELCNVPEESEFKSGICKYTVEKCAQGQTCSVGRVVDRETNDRTFFFSADAGVWVAWKNSVCYQSHRDHLSEGVSCAKRVQRHSELSCVWFFTSRGKWASRPLGCCGYCESQMLSGEELIEEV